MLPHPNGDEHPRGHHAPGEHRHEGHGSPEVPGQYRDRLEYIRALRELRRSLGIPGIRDGDWPESLFPEV